MKKLAERIPLTWTIVLVVSLLLALGQGAGIAIESLRDYQRMSAASKERASAALDMLEAVHSQAMKERLGLGDGDKATAVLDGAMKRFSAASDGTRLWVFMGPKVLDYQNANGSNDEEPPADAVDRAAANTLRPQSTITGSTFRLSRPIVLGEGAAGDASCTTCHTRSMNVKAGELLGGYSAAVDMTKQLAAWKASLARRALWAVCLLIAIVGAATLLLTRFALLPLSQLVTATKSLASGHTDPPIPYLDRLDELGSLARALDMFKRSIVARRTLEVVNADATRKLEHMASHDGLTGLPNRVLFAERVKKMIVQQAADGGQVAVFRIDIDHFKDCNDRLGYAGGDVVLQAVAERLARNLGEKGVAARHGGDEFAVAMVLGPDDDSGSIADQIMSFLQAMPVEDQQAAVTVSAGIALAPCDGDEIESLLRHAEQALWGAKTDGRGTYRFFRPQMNEAVDAKRDLESDLYRAFEDGGLELYYQPIQSTGDRSIVAVEALMRWRHPDKGWISPADFIPIAEANGLIIPLGRWLLRRACQEVARWPGLKVAVNVSPAQLRDREFVGFLSTVLGETGLEPGRLELEITEGVFLDPAINPLTILRQVKALGVGLAMDDFGTGFSSLTYLQKYPFDKIKIDRSFVGVMTTDASAKAIVGAVIGLGRNLKMTTTAEGVETEEQLEALRREGCDQVQGYLLSRPLDAFQLAVLLKEQEEAAARSAGRSPKARRSGGL
ncbi:bifunctional diguanylate cyclase/phosphodiesterase [Rhizobium sp. BK376]|uniref:putative bifunctional diguanylate cyclase/phosphodiesterase n=1 Tax=Rhizobium sp. BK376 TaxID=2512149 RepID=UPI0010509D46|nr:bifunctional diguanylate cyclase/phosphodiesterase [Rhizobium sp. BK376]TCR75609.1 diguanylate cyclase (GGDEF)-like protein [Rhizobium sp. BK376]